MRFHRCPSPICGRPFQLNQFGSKFSIAAEQGKIICPHCGLVIEGDRNSLFLTHALSAEQEAEFNAKNPLGSLNPLNAIKAIKPDKRPRKKA